MEEGNIIYENECVPFKQIRTGVFNYWIKSYFDLNEEDLEEFFYKTSRDRLCLQIRSKNDDRGYVFVLPLKLEENCEEIMREIRKEHEIANRIPVRSFVDHENDGFSGFSWRREEDAYM